MGRVWELHLRMRRPGLLARAWYRRIGLPVPTAVGSTGPVHADVARLVPYPARCFHHWYATACGYFWLPCPWCGQPFGGHEGGGSMSDPTRPGYGITVCSRCTRAGRGDLRVAGGRHVPGLLRAVLLAACLLAGLVLWVVPLILMIR